MKQRISQLLAEILKAMQVEGAEILVEVPENPDHGEYTTNIAMLLAKRLKAPPRDVAQKIVDTIKKYQKMSSTISLSWLEAVEIAGPGFINFYLSEDYFGSVVAEVLKEKERYGALRKNVHSSSLVVNGDLKTGPDAKAGSGKKIKSRKFAKSDKFRSSVVPISSIPAGKMSQQEESALFGKTVMVEYAHPNTHKAFHIGHLRNITIGEAIIRLLESQANRVIRVNYQGDVGMHIAKALYALIELEPYKTDVREVKEIKDRVELLGKAYAAGSKAFEESEKAKERIKDFNYFVYAAAERLAVERGLPKPSTDYLAFIQGDKGMVDTVYELWKETRQWSLDYFDGIYARLGSRYDRFYFESECLTGVDAAKDAVHQGVLHESDGAIIFDGTQHGIDTRVFVNSLGLPTYEGKELALSRMETTEFGELDKIIHVVGPEQASFFKVTFKAEELLGIVKPGVQKHLVYGWVKLKHGKMSSRTGQVVLGEWLLDEAKKEIYAILQKNKSNYLKEDQEMIAETGAIAAVKYAFLKVGTNQEIAFDLAESVSFEGDSGPYLLYSYARAKSVLRKAEGVDSVLVPGSLSDLRFNPEERMVIRRIGQFPEVVAEAAARFAPNTLCTYLFHLAQEYNLLYAKHEILGNPARLVLTAATAQTLRNGLYLLGIPVIERM